MNLTIIIYLLLGEGEVAGSNVVFYIYTGSRSALFELIRRVLASSVSPTLHICPRDQQFSSSIPSLFSFCLLFPINRVPD